MARKIISVKSQFVKFAAVVLEILQFDNKSVISDP
jgi:hypothetical protein